MRADVADQATTLSQWNEACRIQHHAIAPAQTHQRLEPRQLTVSHAHDGLIDDLEALLFQGVLQVFDGEAALPL